MPFVVGETVGPYRIVEQLGQGGMATVFKAYHPALDRYVAIKAMHPAFMEDPNFLARFQREAQVVARLDHSNIVPIYDYAEHEGRPYLVMKYIEGETLKAYLGRGKLSEDEIVHVVQAVSAALSYAHGQGILHRDIKPSNVLIGANGTIYLADFGLAKIAEAGQSTLSSDVMLGTPQYISPEQAMGKSDLDASSDIYSFGVMLYEMMVGRVPFNADTPYSIIHDHIYTPMPLPKSIDPSISESMERVLLKALAKEPADRYRDVVSLGAAIQEALLSEPSTDRETLAGTLSGQAQSDLTLAPPEPSPAPVGELRSEGPAAGALPATGGAAAEPIGSDSPDMVKGKGRWRWWYAVPILLTLCICGFLALSILSEDGNPGTSQGTAGSNGQPAPQGEIPPGELPPRELEERLKAAEEAVRRNPDDPFARLELGLAYLDMGDYDNAQATLVEAQNLAGDENPEFFLASADLLAERDMWLLAAGMYFKFAALHPEGLPPDIAERVELAIYLAAGDPGARAMIGARDRFPGLDPLMVDTVKARYQYAQGKIGLAESLLESVFERAPGYAAAELLLAEILLESGEQEEAISILAHLAGRDEPPFWVNTVAGYKLEELEG